LKHFRADSIVRDCEHVRRDLLPDAGAWSVLGQSYGGFCACTYLSFAPEGLRAVFITGGVAPIGAGPEEVYRRTYRKLREKNQFYYERYPDDAEHVRRIVDHLERNDVRRPEGDQLTPRKLQQIGLHFGMSDGFEMVHYLLEDAFVEGASGPEISHVFLHGFEHILAYNTNPIFSILHEAAYAEGVATRWAAERVRAEFPEFDVDGDHTPVLFTGEMIYAWMFEEYGKLRPLREAAQLLAEDADWPLLYDRARLGANTVPCAATAYYDDMYVDRELALRAADGIANLRLWITNEHEHNALRAKGDQVLDRLIGMVRGDR
jgi:pimeloyl-ACP methyl ester carboxylesterase